MTDLGASATPSGSRATHEAPAGLHPTGFDPSRDGFPVSRLIHAASRIATAATEETGDLAYGTWNPQFCAADASGRAREFFGHLRILIDHYDAQAAIAMEARQGGDGETRLHPKDDSAGRKASPKEGQS